MRRTLSPPILLSRRHNGWTTPVRLVFSIQVSRVDYHGCSERTAVCQHESTLQQWRYPPPDSVTYRFG